MDFFNLISVDRVDLLKTSLIDLSKTSIESQLFPHLQSTYTRSGRSWSWSTVGPVEPVEPDGVGWLRKLLRIVMLSEDKDLMAYSGVW